MKNSPRLFKHFLAIFVVLAYLLTPGTVNGQTPEGWSRFDNDSEIQITSVAALTISDSGDIYAAGSFDTPAGVLPSAIARWNGETWVFLASAIEPEGHIVPPRCNLAYLLSVYLAELAAYVDNSRRSPKDTPHRFKPRIEHYYSRCSRPHGLPALSSPTRDVE